MTKRRFVGKEGELHLGETAISAGCSALMEILVSIHFRRFGDFVGVLSVKLGFLTVSLGALSDQELSGVGPEYLL